MSFSTPRLSPRFVYDPYNTTESKRIVSPSPSAASDFGASIAASSVAPPPAFAHPALERCVNFVVYPADAVCAPPVASALPKEQLTRLFIGQLPYRISDGLLQRVVFDVTGVYIYGIERIIKWSKGRQPTGCVHAYCDPDAAGALLEGLPQRVLFDDMGYWCAQSDYEAELLQSYCDSLDRNRSQRPADRPCQTMTVEAARSTYAPRGKSHRNGPARW